MYISKWMTVSFFGAIAACGSEPAPLLLEIDSQVALVEDWPDKQAEAEKRLPWTNFKTHDTLNDQFDIQVKPPNMMLVAQRDRFAQNPVKAILQQGSVNFWVVSEFYRRGIEQIPSGHHP